jgi:F-type H+-transporting ATPase subunit epsilon
LISQLKTGVLTYTQDTRNTQLLVSGGFVEVRDDHVAVLAVVAERPEEIDASSARATRDRLEKQLGAWTGSEQELELARTELARSEVRLQLAAKA